MVWGGSLGWAVHLKLVNAASALGLEVCLAGGQERLLQDARVDAHMPQQAHNGLDECAVHQLALPVLVRCVYDRESV